MQTHEHALRRFWEATSGICYRTLQYQDSQVPLYWQSDASITADATAPLMSFSASNLT